jgi:Ion channel
LASETTPQRSMMSRYWRALSFSVYVFTKIGYGGVYARHQYKYVVLAEWLLGFVLWVMFVINLSNTFPIVHRLVTMLS